MSGGNTTSEIGTGLLGAGLIASNVMTGGADTPLDAIALGGDAGGGAFIPAAGMDSGLFSSAVGGMGSGLGEATGTALDTGMNGIDQISQMNQQQGWTSPYSQPTSGDFANMTPQEWSAQTQGLTPTQAAALTNPQQATAQPWYTQAWNAATNNPNSSMYNPNGMNLAQKGLLGGAGIATLLALQKSGAMKPNYLTPYNPTSAASMGLGTQMGANYAPNRASQWGYATGGVATPTDVMPADLQQQAQLPSQVQQLMSQYGVTPQEVSQTTQALGVSQPGTKMAHGGITSLKEGSFVMPADVVSHFGNGSTDAGLDALHKHLGAHPIMGDGDGMSDSIPTTIDGKQPARVANGEALVHPEKVKELGNGSADAGAKKLYQMMDRVRKARTGNSKQGKQIKADKYLPT